MTTDFTSNFQHPTERQRNYSSPRKYQLDLTTKVATEVWNYEQNQSVYSPICSCVYEDAPLNYLIDFSSVMGGAHTYWSGARIRPIDKIFGYQIPNVVVQPPTTRDPFTWKTASFQQWSLECRIFRPAAQS